MFDCHSHNRVTKLYFLKRVKKIYRLMSFAWLFILIPYPLLSAQIFLLVSFLKKPTTGITSVNSQSYVWKDDQPRLSRVNILHHSQCFPLWMPWLVSRWSRLLCSILFLRSEPFGSDARDNLSTSKRNESTQVTLQSFFLIPVSVQPSKGCESLLLLQD